MKRLVFLTVCLVFVCANGFAQSYKGEKGVSSVGVILGHAITHKAPTIGVDYRYNVLDRVRLAPSALYTLKNDYINAFYVNADAHYLSRITDNVTIYPLAGLGLSVWKWDAFVIDDLDDLESLLNNGLKSKSETKTRIGLNLGFGGEMRITKDVVLGAEFRYNLTSERIYDQAMILMRAAYYF